MVAVYRTIAGSFSETVTAKPAVAAYDTAAGEALRVAVARTDSDGKYSFDLPPSNEVNPDGVYWTVFEPGGNQITILVPTSDTPIPNGGWLVDDIRVVGPEDPASVLVGVNPEVYAADQAALQAEIAARQPVDPVLTINRDPVSGLVTSVVEDGVTTTYTRDAASGRITGQTRLGVTRTYRRDAAGNLTGVS